MSPSYPELNIKSSGWGELRSSLVMPSIFFTHTFNFPGTSSNHPLSSSKPLPSSQLAMTPKGIPALLLSGWVDWISPPGPWLFSLSLPKRNTSLIQKRNFCSLSHLHQLLLGCPPRLFFPLPSLMLPGNGKSPEKICKAFYYEFLLLFLGIGFIAFIKFLSL